MINSVDFGVLWQAELAGTRRLHIVPKFPISSVEIPQGAAIKRPPTPGGLATASKFSYWYH